MKKNTSNGLNSMANEQYNKVKIKLNFTKSQVKKAGENIRKSNNIDESIEIIQNYRAAHLYPLMIIKNLAWRHVQKIYPNAIIARRLKRLPTIIDKLQRRTLDGKSNNSICITRMQDIGGCRVIVDNKKQLEDINESLNKSRTKHITKKIVDYNKAPKSTGYRGIHRVYNCYGNLPSHDWKGFTIELQLRTRLQHLWATTIEVVDLCEGKTLKTNPYDADPMWVDFFKKMSEFLAYKDGFIKLSNEELNVLKEKLIALNLKLTAIDRLSSFNLIFSDKSIMSETKNKRYAIIFIQGKHVYYKFFSEKMKASALKMYSDIEKDPDCNSLFVEMDDIKKISIAYPNYLIDTKEFIDMFKEITASTFWVKPSTR